MSTTFSPASRGISGSYVQLTVSTTVYDIDDIANDPSMVNAAQSIYISVRSGEINFTYDGTDPTTSTGHVLSTSAQPTGPYVARAFKMIRNGGTDATVDITLEG